jgi:hypothetical protein
VLCRQSQTHPAVGLALYFAAICAKVDKNLFLV